MIVIRTMCDCVTRPGSQLSIRTYVGYVTCIQMSCKCCDCHRVKQPVIHAYCMWLYHPSEWPAICTYMWLYLRPEWPVVRACTLCMWLYHPSNGQLYVLYVTMSPHQVMIIHTYYMYLYHRVNIDYTCIHVTVICRVKCELSFGATWRTYRLSPDNDYPYILYVTICASE
jgi:hypothetical protein